MHGQRVLQLGGIFNCHAGTLRQVRAHGVRSVAQQRHQALRHLRRALQRRAVRQRPQPPAAAIGGNAPHQVLQSGAGAGQGAFQVGGVGGMVPALQIARRCALHDDHQVLQLAPAHRVLNGVQARPQPGRDMAGAQRWRQGGLRHQRAVGQVAAGAWRAVSEQARARGAPKAVCADEGVALHFLALAGAHQHGAIGFGVLVNGQVQVQLHGIACLHRLEQQPVQVGAVDGGVGGAITRYCLGAQRQHCQFAPRESTAHLQAVRESGHGLQGLLESPGLQAPHHVRAQLHAGAHFAEGGSAFVQPHLPASARRGQCRSQSANASARNQHLFFHGAIVPAALCSAAPRRAHLLCAQGSSQARPAKRSTPCHCCAQKPRP